MWSSDNKWVPIKTKQPPNSGRWKNTDNFVVAQLFPRKSIYQLVSWLTPACMFCIYWEDVQADKKLDVNMFFHRFNVAAIESKRDCSGGEGFLLAAAGSLPVQKAGETPRPSSHWQTSCTQNARLISLHWLFLPNKSILQQPFYLYHFIRGTKGWCLTQPAENLDVYFLRASWYLLLSQHLHIHLPLCIWTFPPCTIRPQVHIAQPSACSTEDAQLWSAW